MQTIVINGGNKLNGEVTTPTAKNSLLPIMAGAILVDGVVRIREFERFSDCYAMIDILRGLGAKSTIKGRELILDCASIDKHIITSDLAIKLRASIYTLGAVIARQKQAKIAYPGGCLIGTRPIDQHLKGLRTLGVRIIEQHGYLFCDGEGLHSGEVYLDLPSVGATYNIILASVCNQGVTTIHNVAKEPEIVDFQNFLNTCGADISGAGTDTIVVRGIGRLLHGGEYKPIGDRIIAGTYLIAVAGTGGNVKVKNIEPKHLESLLYRLEEMGCVVYRGKRCVRIVSNGELKALGKLETLPYPSFPTDLQAPIMALLCRCKGDTVITENLFESRFKHINELNKMGASILVSGNTAIVKGVDMLYGADVYVTDLRAGASLVVAGLIAKGYTTIHNVEYIKRGYVRLEKSLKRLGANIYNKNIKKGS